MKTYTDGYGEKRYVATLPIDVLRRLVDALAADHPRLADDLRIHLVAAGADPTVTVDLVVTEAATVSAYLDRIQ